MDAKIKRYVFRWLDHQIENLTEHYLADRIEALERKIGKDDYSQGLSEGSAIHKKIMRDELRHFRRHLESVIERKELSDALSGHAPVDPKDIPED